MESKNIKISEIKKTLAELDEESDKVFARSKAEQKAGNENYLWSDGYASGICHAIYILESRHADKK